MSAGLWLTGSAVALAAFLLSGGKKPGKKKPNDGTRPPYVQPVWVPTGPNGDDLIRAEICRLAQAGTTVLTPVLSRAVWRVIWQGVPWPVRATDHATVVAAAAILDSLVAEYLADPVAFCERFNDDDDGAPTPIDLSEYEDPYPTPGMMYQVKKDDILGGTFSTRSIAYRALLSAGYLAGLDVLGLDDEAASQFARELALNNQARAIYIRMIQCDLYNDFFYGTEGFNPEITSGNPNGRGLRLLAIHADNRARIAAGLAPLRVVDSVTGVGQSGGEYEYLDMPLLDLDQVAKAHLPIDDRLVLQAWPDGSVNLPAPAIADLINLSLVPPGVYGCGSHTLEV